MATTELTLTEVPLPHMASMETATLTTWTKQVGETVNEGETICEVTTEKVDTEIESPATGVVAAHLFEPGVELALGTVVALLAAPGLEPAEVQAAVASYTRAGTPAVQEALPPATPAPSTSNGSSATSGHRLLASPLAKRVAKENGIDIASLTGTGSRGKITRDDVLAAIDAKSAPVAAPVVAAAPAVAPATATATGD